MCHLLVERRFARTPPIQTAFRPQCNWMHVLAADGAFLPGGRFVALTRVPERLLAEGFRRAVLDFLVENEALSEDFRGRMLAWRYSGFSAHNEVSVAAEDAEGRKKLAGYMLRAPMSYPAHPRALGAVGAARHRAQSAARPRRELAAACQLAASP